MSKVKVYVETRGLRTEHRYKARCVQVIDYRTIVATVELGFGAATDVHLRIKGVKALRSEKKIAEANDALHTKLIDRDIVVETERVNDEFVAAVYLDGAKL